MGMGVTVFTAEQVAMQERIRDASIVAVEGAGGTWPCCPACGQPAMRVDWVIGRCWCGWRQPDAAVASTGEE